VSRAGGAAALGVAVALVLQSGRAEAGLNSWSDLGLDGGEVLRVVAAPGGQVVYAGTASGLFESTDGGLSWGLIQEASGGMLPLAVDPSHPDTVYATRGGYLYRSADAGSTWYLLGGTPTDSSGLPIYIASLVVDPRNGQRLWVAGGGLFRSDDGGMTWTAAGGIGYLLDMAQDPNDSDRLYLASMSQGLLRSTDGGITFVASNPDVPSPSAYHVSVSSRAPAVVLAEISTESYDAHQILQKSAAIYRSTDSGGSWTKLFDNPLFPLILDAKTFLIIAPDGVWRTGDGGASWKLVTAKGFESFAADPADPNIAWARAADGLYRSTDAGQTWANSSTGIRASSVVAVALDPTDPQTAYVASGLGLFKSSNEGASWARACANEPPGLTAQAVLLDLKSPQSFLTLLSTSPLRSSDGGQNCSPTGLLPYGGNLLGRDSQSPATVYAAGARVSRSTDGGGTWANMPLSDVGTITALAADPTTSGTLYVGSYVGFAYKSTDYGSTWAQLGETDFGPSPAFALAIDPSAPMTVYEGRGSGLYKSIDGGASFRLSVNGMTNQVTQAVLVDKTSPSTVYAGTWDGVYKSMNGGADWSNIGLDLPNHQVQTLTLSPQDPNVIWAGAVGGAYRLEQVPPRIAALTPGTGSSLGGTRLRIDGAYFMRGAQVTVGGAPAADVTFIGPTALDVTVPRGTTGPVDVRVTNPTYMASAAGDAFQYLPICRLSTVPEIQVPGEVVGLQEGVKATAAGIRPGSSVIWNLSNGTITDGQGTSEITFNAGSAGFVVVQAVESTGADCRSSAATAVVIVRSPVQEVVTGRQIVPIVLDVLGAAGSHYTTELTLENNGGTTVSVQLVYTPAAALGSYGAGVAMERLSAYQEIVIPDVLAHLRAEGLVIPDAAQGPQGGTLQVLFTNLQDAGDGYASARTTSPSGSGSAGLAYAGLPLSTLADSAVWLFGLRESPGERTNLAVGNAGDTGDITLRVTLYPAGGGQSLALPDVVLQPGQWSQTNRALATAGYSQGYARVERVQGDSPFFAYAVFNDNVTNDGSYVPAVSTQAGAEPLILPVLVETPVFKSELILANPGSVPATVTMSYVESLSPALGPGGTVTEVLQAGEQRIIPGATDFLRAKGVPVGAVGSQLAGSLSIRFTVDGGLVPGFAGARAAANGPGGGTYGTFYPAVPISQAATDEAWVFGLRETATTRSNLALVNAGETGSVTLRCVMYEPRYGSAVAVLDGIELEPHGWRQLDRVLESFPTISEGYVRITKTGGVGPFLAYGVLNDNGTNDGSYVAMARPVLRNLAVRVTLNGPR
jgi:photosystem II stability/assembly factor-like uncharacterized protein